MATESKLTPRPARRGPRGVCAALAISLVLAGCAGITPGLESPRVSLVALEIIEMTLFEQRYGLTLRLQNPNDLDLRIKGVDYEVELNGETFGSGVSNEPAVVPAFGEASIDVTMVSSLGRMIGQFDRLFRDGRDGGATLDYAIRGRVSLEGVLVALPFSKEGSIELPGREDSTLRASTSGAVRLPSWPRPVR